MRFTLIDRITDLQPGERIAAVKGLSMAEEYLQDHFPLFPVMPGVLMLEALYQASAWLVRETDDFAHSMVQLSEARNVTYKDFVQPGESLVVEARIQKRVDNLVWIQAEGKVNERQAVKARLILDCFNLAERGLASSSVDVYIVNELRRDLENLRGLKQLQA
jgi:3-hydroxyacyl-[acyl-carrier-protein] dehydratase